jgi:hypothetical protein
VSLSRISRCCVDGAAAAAQGAPVLQYLPPAACTNDAEVFCASVYIHRYVSEGCCVDRGPVAAQGAPVLQYSLHS